MGDLNPFESLGEMIEAIYRHIRYYKHSRIQTALKMPPAVFVTQTFSDCQQGTKKSPVFTD